MTTASVLMLLQAALSLLTLVQSTPNIPESLQTTAIQTAQQAITVATSQLSANTIAGENTASTQSSASVQSETTVQQTPESTPAQGEQACTTLVETSSPSTSPCTYYVPPQATTPSSSSSQPSNSCISTFAGSDGESISNGQQVYPNNVTGLCTPTASSADCISYECEDGKWVSIIPI